MKRPRIVLLTQCGSKREVYFCNALQALSTDCVVFYDVSGYLADRLPGDIIKIDPPDIRDFSVEELSLFTAQYIENLMSLSADPTLRFLNTPTAIITALDKRATKQALLAAAVPTPPAFTQEVNTFEELLLLMDAARCRRVFIKPRFGSGAAAVCAFAFDFRQKRGVIYTSLARKNNQWINTKKIQKITEQSLYETVINFVLSLDAVIEQWIPKPSINGLTFDLRVVWQFGKIETVVVRGSKSPITNLHLNDLALPTELAKEWIQLDSLQEICTQAVVAIPGLTSAGLDILCTPQGYQVIEINSQGDLIYRDIFHENIIYTHQGQYLIALADEACTTFCSLTKD